MVFYLLEWDVFGYDNSQALRSLFFLISIRLYIIYITKIIVFTMYIKRKNPQYFYLRIQSFKPWVTFITFYFIYGGRSTFVNHIREGRSFNLDLTLIS